MMGLGLLFYLLAHGLGLLETAAAQDNRPPELPEGA
jgi:hypothetical protein